MQSFGICADRSRTTVIIDVNHKRRAKIGRLSAFTGLLPSADGQLFFI
jgi:hypothetical protein